MLVLAALHVDVREREPGLAPRSVEGLTEPREHAPQLVPARRVEPGSVPEHLADLLVLPRRHVLEHLELTTDEPNAEDRPPQKTKGGPQVALLDQTRGLVRVVPGELEPQLRRLVGDLEEKLVPVHPLVLHFLERQKLVRVQVPLVVRGGFPGQERLRVVLGGLVSLNRGLFRISGHVGRSSASDLHVLSILRAWETSSPKPRTSDGTSTRRWPCVSGPGHSTSLSGSSTGWGRARRCGSRSNRPGRRR